jgi:hypothetical protein
MKPTGVATADGHLVVVCDNGAVFRLEDRQWVEWTPLPGSMRQAEVSPTEYDAWMRSEAARPRSARRAHGVVSGSS